MGLKRTSKLMLSTKYVTLKMAIPETTIVLMAVALLRKINCYIIF